MDEILSKDRRHLTLFENNIAIDKRLLKWKRAEAGIETTKSPNDPLSNDASINRNTSVGGFIIGTTPDEYRSEGLDPDRNVGRTTNWLPLYETPEGIKFDDLATAGIQDLTRMIVEKKLKYVMAGYGSFGTTVGTLTMNSNYVSYEVKTNDGDEKNIEKKSWLKKVFNLFGKKEKKEEEIPAMDALKFFSLVKLTSKESAGVYVDRVSKYLTALHNATNIGQTALQEELIRGLITNRYESVLFAEGYYYAITETQMVDFVRQCEKGIKLSYLKNFNRPIPQNVIDKVAKLNELEVFDNYVVLYYDPDGNIYKETAQEQAKRRDPIIFGLIAGSRKLYYVDDWIDEYCDLTLEAFIDSLGITKDDIHFDADEIKKEKSVTQIDVEKKTKKRKKSKNNN
jgi:hypothetical protein